MTSLPNPSGEAVSDISSGLCGAEGPGVEDPRKGEGAGAPLREEVALGSPVPSDSAANGRGPDILTYSGDVEEVECPACRKMNSLLDPSIDGCLKPGYVFTCDHCNARILVSAVDYDIHVYCQVAR